MHSGKRLLLSLIVQDRLPILKVYPELTFVLREALYSLDLIASDLAPDYDERPFSMRWKI